MGARWEGGRRGARPPGTPPPPRVNLGSASIARRQRPNSVPLPVSILFPSAALAPQGSPPHCTSAFPLLLFVCLHILSIIPILDSRSPPSLISEERVNPPPGNGPGKRGLSRRPRRHIFSRAAGGAERTRGWWQGRRASGSWGRRPERAGGNANGNTHTHTHTHARTHERVLERGARAAGESERRVRADPSLPGR